MTEQRKIEKALGIRKAEHHVPQVGDDGSVNPYHATCPKCNSGNGEYCKGRGTDIDGVGFIPHRERKAAALNSEKCKHPSHVNEKPIDANHHEHVMNTGKWMFHSHEGGQKGHHHEGVYRG